MNDSRKEIITDLQLGSAHVKRLVEASMTQGQMLFHRGFSIKACPCFAGEKRLAWSVHFTEKEHKLVRHHSLLIGITACSLAYCNSLERALSVPQWEL